MMFRTKATPTRESGRICVGWESEEYGKLGRQEMSEVGSAGVARGGDSGRETGF